MTDHLFGKELFIRFTATVFRKLPSIYVFSYFPFGYKGRMWDLIVSVPDRCLSFYFTKFNETQLNKYIQELWFLRSAHRLMLVNISVTFHEDILNGFSSYRADTILWRMDRRPWQNKMKWGSIKLSLQIPKLIFTTRPYTQLPAHLCTRSPIIKYKYKWFIVI